MDYGEILLPAQHGRSLAEGVGLHAAGCGTAAPRAVTDAGAVLHFGRRKGSCIALKIERLAAR